MPLLKVEDVVNKTFDYVIIGGGTAGLTLATRLSEVPSISVLVLEAGHASLDDPNIYVPGQNLQILGNPDYDWAFTTVKEGHTNDREIVWNRGKCLGGSSALNLYIWSKPPTFDIDAFERLGNPGWNWEEYQKYTLKAEHFHPAEKDVMEHYPHTYDSKFHGFCGPIHVSMAPHAYTINKLVEDTLVHKGIDLIKDPYGGNVSGTWISADTFKHESSEWKRSYSASGYLVPNLHRPNLNILTEALVSHIIFEDGPQGSDVTASSVAFIVGDHPYSVNVAKEVIVSAGTINSPKILELSGIGRADILSSIGVDLKVNLPGVGENVQEHMRFMMTYELNLSPEFIKEHIKDYTMGNDFIRPSFFAFLPIQQCNLPDSGAVIAKAEEDANRIKAKGIPGLAEQVDIWLEMLRNEKEPDFEYTMKLILASGDNTKSYSDFMCCSTHPLSRGSIHAQSMDPKMQPQISPKYFEYDSDLNLFVQQFKYIRTLLETEPWKSTVVTEANPGFACKTDEQIKEYIKQTFLTTWHTVGSCSMVPRQKNGVVDPQLRVYGTKNVRVVDISIMPLHVAAHTQTFAYFIGEKAADLIKTHLKK